MRLDDLSETDRNFYDLFSRYWELLAKRDTKREDEIDLWNSWVDFIYHDQVTPRVVVQAFSDMLAKYPDFKWSIALAMWDMATLKQMHGKYPYPEFFWLILQSDLLSNDQDFADLIKYLSDIGGPEIMRAYLTLTLLTTDDLEKRRKVIFSFYYTGVRVDTLRIIRQVIPLDERNLDLYVMVFGNALGSLFNPKVAMLSDDKLYLRDFFTMGLTLLDSQIVEYSQRALARLDELSSQGTA
jgi:hypothetical protein